MIRRATAGSLYIGSCTHTYGNSSGNGRAKRLCGWSECWYRRRPAGRSSLPSPSKASSDDCANPSIFDTHLAAMDARSNTPSRAYAHNMMSGMCVKTRIIHCSREMPTVAEPDSSCTSSRYPSYASTKFEGARPTRPPLKRAGYPPATAVHQPAPQRRLRPSPRRGHPQPSSTPSAPRTEPRPAKWLSFTEGNRRVPSEKSTIFEAEDFGPVWTNSLTIIRLHVLQMTSFRPLRPSRG